MISLIKIYLEKIKDYIVELLYEELNMEERILDKYGDVISQQRQHITYLSQRVHALNKPIIDVQSKNIHYPSLDEMIYEYKLFKFTKTLKPSNQTILLEIKGHGLKTDYRYVDQANHKLYMKIVSKDKESVWYNCCETIQAIGLVEKDGCYCIRNDRRNKTTAYQRICYIPSSEINGECTIFLRFGKKIEQDISCESINTS
jgi:hypothetical protein